MLRIVWQAVDSGLSLNTRCSLTALCCLNLCPVLYVSRNLCCRTIHVILVTWVIYADNDVKCLFHEMNYD